MIRPTTIAELRTRGSAAIAAAAAETGVSTDVQWHRFEQMEDAGILELLAVDVDGELVGYVCAVILPELFRPLTTCTTLSVFVLRAHRRRWGWPLLAALARAAAVRDVDWLRVQALPGSRLHQLMLRLGAVETSVTLEVEPMRLWRRAV